MKEVARRSFLKSAALIGSGVALLPRSSARAEEAGKEKGGVAQEDVTPLEDLMREHGLLRRVLLIYGEELRRLEAQENILPDVLLDSARIVRSFVEEYHEKLEEDYLFPRLRKAGKMVDLVEVLKQQHDAGRALTDNTMRLANAKALKEPANRQALSVALKQFIRMYEPHAAREDTILFPAFRAVLSAKEYDALGDEFEKKETEKFGEGGFEKMLARVAELESALGIFILAQFTPVLK